MKDRRAVMMRLTRAGLLVTIPVLAAGYHTNPDSRQLFWLLWLAVMLLAISFVLPSLEPKDEDR